MISSLSFLLLATSCTAVILEKISDLPQSEYDFIVVGGGTAGNVIANRLTEDPKVSVLVLEAGGNDENALNPQVPFFCNRLATDTPYDWNYTTAPQPTLNGRALPYPRGYTLGGSSVTNYMMYTRGSSEDYDRYANITKDEGWSWDNLQPYIKRIEKFSPPTDNHNTTGQFNPAVHGFDGVNHLTLPGSPEATDSLVIQATRELPNEFPFNLDMNSGNHLGIGWIQATINNGTRDSSATAYLAPQYTRRRNLHVLVNARVTRLLRNKSIRGLSLRTVEFAQSNGGSRHQVIAKKEVILSAGVIGTPHILMHSGIGDSKALSAHGIKTVLHLPSVGKNLVEHPIYATSWSVNGNNTRDDAARNATLADEQLQQWKDTRTGPLVVTTFNQLGWLRIPDNATIFKDFKDPSAGPNAAHYEFILHNGMLGPVLPTGHYMSMGVVNVAPTSRGSVTLNSSNPFDAPIIDLNMLSNDLDMFILREAVRSMQRFVEAPVFAKYIVSPLANLTTDAQVDASIRDTAFGIYHPVGTAAMSAKGAKTGVVDPDLRVKGVEGLRIVDASVFPEIPTAHTQAPVYIFAERASDLIKAAWNLDQ